MRHLYGDKDASFGIKNAHSIYIARMDASATWLIGLSKQPTPHTLRSIRGAMAWISTSINSKRALHANDDPAIVAWLRKVEGL